MNQMVFYWNVGLYILISLTYPLVQRGYMKESKSKNKTVLTINEKLVKMFEDQTPEDRQQVLRDIDSIMCNMLELQLDDLPWINPNKHEEKWEKLMNNLRLIVGRIEYESKRKTRTVH
jgi:hypothetical protein